MAITYVDAANFAGVIQPLTSLAAAYESRATQIARLFVPIASFAGDTAQTLTDGSFNSNNASILKSSTAVLATPANILNATNTTAPGNNQVTAKPLIIRVQRDPFSGEITNYGVFNADGTVPGYDYAGDPSGLNGSFYAAGMQKDPFDPAQDPRYLVDRMTGQVYLNNGAGINGVNLDAFAGAEITRDDDALEIITANPNANPAQNVVGIVEFKALEGAALSTAQQRASELSNVIQSLSTLIRGIFDSERSLLNTLR